MVYYQNIITEKSWQLLQTLKKELKDFILIGGWAIFLYTKALKSKDIDIIIDYQTLKNLRQKFNLVKNDRLKKYEIKKEGIDIDIYLPFYSNPGMPIEIIQRYLHQKEGFTLPKPEVLLILKQYVYLRRQGTIKGEKDKLDIFSLLTYPLDFNFYQKILKETKREKYAKHLSQLLKEAIKVKELGSSNHYLAKLRKKVLSSLG